MNDERINNESFLLQGLATSSEEAFAQLYAAHRSAVFALALRLLKTRPLAEETCNDVFTAVWQSRERLAGVQSVRAYLLTATRNRSINTLKMLARQQASLHNLQRTMQQRPFDTEAHLLHKEYVAFIRQKVAALPPRAKEVFGLCREEGYSYEEVSARLGISRNAVKSHMVYSMKKLKSLAEKDLGISFSLGFLFLHFF